ncbi:XdhC family protein [Gallaecimonas pentaromativorans]|uniref:XdhC family protein n=1 Tax=Gallaecimonas pentaromativorans TaxID=584787 RepID=UPI003A9087E8
MQSLDIQVLDRAGQWAANDVVWLCTVLSTFGSSPRPPGTLMALKQGGFYCGSLSGGCVEEDFMARIEAGDFTQPSQVVRYGQGGLTPNRALPCGGVLDILVERLAPGAASQQYLQQMQNAVGGATSLYKHIVLPGPCQTLTPREYASNTIAEYDDNTVSLTVSAAPRLVIAGLSAVALFCADFAVALGFETLVCESREEVLANFESSLSKGVVLVREFPARYLEKHGCHSGTAVVSLTHDPRVDDMTLLEAVNTDAFYIGAMGSERNSQSRMARLRELGEMTPAQLARIHAPIGMDIGSKTPAEIALSVLADIVRHKNKLGAIKPARQLALA